MCYTYKMYRERKLTDHESSEREKSLKREWKMKQVNLLADPQIK